MLSKLNNELLTRGPAAVLPQNLTDAWLTTLQERAEVYLDAAYDLEVCKEPSDDADPMLVACVFEIYHQGGKAPDSQIEPQKMGEMLTIYALSLVVESAVRNHGLSAPQPELKNFFSWNRIRKLGKKIPELSDFLNQACILKSSKTGWINSIKGKILSGLSGSSPLEQSD